MFLFSGKSPISIPLDPTSQSKLKNSSLCQSKICTDSVKGYDCGDAIADWISEALEISYLRLIRQSSSDGRTQKKKDEIEQKPLSLSNQAQYLLINKATVRWLSDKIHDPLFTDDIDMLVDRFRGNLVIDMETELAERDWSKIIIGKHEFKVVSSSSCSLNSKIKSVTRPLFVVVVLNPIVRGIIYICKNWENKTIVF